jgi:hypothetical protein
MDTCMSITLHTISMDTTMTQHKYLVVSVMIGNPVAQYEDDAHTPIITSQPLHRRSCVMVHGEPFRPC